MDEAFKFPNLLVLEQHCLPEEVQLMQDGRPYAAEGAL